MESGQETAKIESAALRLLRYRERSVAEMRARLAQKGFADEAVEEEIRDLILRNLLDDERFAGAWIRHKLTISNKGKRLIRAELASKGITSDLFEKVWAEHAGLEKESALKWAKAKAARYSRLTPFERRGRIRQGLYRRGYSAEAITEALEGIG